MNAKHNIATSILILIALFSSIGRAIAIPIDKTPLSASIPFTDNFESDTFDSAVWITNMANNGIVEINSDNPHTGSKNAYLGQKTNGSATAELALAIDLSNTSDAFLDFWWRANSNTTNGGIYISDNGGASWTEIHNLNQNPQTFRHEIINISSAASANGLNLNANFQIRFSYFAIFNNAPANDAYIIDDLRLDTRSNLYNSFPLVDDFESSSFQKGLFPQTTNKGLSGNNDDKPHSGNKSLFLGQKVRGSATASLILAINLSGNTDVFMDFWWRSTGTGGNGNSGVYISDDDGTSQKQILTFGSQPQTYRHELINIAASASANGINLNQKFWIVFNYNAIFNDGAAGSGYLIDDLRLTTRSNEITSLPINEGFESNVFGKGLYPQITYNGLSQIDADTPHNGIQSLYLGQKVRGSATASLILAIELSNRSDVFMDFWWRSIGNGGSSSSGISVSDDEGVTWKELLSLSGNPQSYQHEILNISDFAQANGLSLNSKFRIQFLYDAIFNDGAAGSAYVIDDLRLSIEDPNGNNRIYLPVVSK